MGKRILIVDDDAGFRRLVRMVLEEDAEFSVVGEADAGEAGLAAARELEPDVVLLDVNLPDTTGFELTPRLTAAVGGADIVLTSSRDDAAYETLAGQAGAVGFVSKHDLSPEAIARLVA